MVPPCFLPALLPSAVVQEALLPASGKGPVHWLCRDRGVSFAAAAAKSAVRQGQDVLEMRSQEQFQGREHALIVIDDEYGFRFGHNA